MTFTVSFMISPSFVALVHKNPSYIECRVPDSRNISLIYVTYDRWPQTQFNHGFRCFTRHRHPQDERIFRSYGSCVFWLCMRTGWVLEKSPSDHYWRRYEVGQWLVFRWFWVLGTLDMRLARRKLGKRNTPQSWWPLLPYGRHGALLPAPPHTAMSHHAAQQVYVVKTRKYYCFYYLLAILRHDASSTRLACTCVCGLRQRVVLRVSYSQRAALRVWCSQCALEHGYSQRRHWE
jgi:hypothetical protein